MHLDTEANTTLRTALSHMQVRGGAVSLLVGQRPIFASMSVPPPPGAGGVTQQASKPLSGAIGIAVHRSRAQAHARLGWAKTERVAGASSRSEAG